MKFFDMHVHSAFSEGESTIEQIARRAKDLGYNGICFSEYYEDRPQLERLKKEIAKAEKKTEVEILLGFEARNTRELKKLSDMRSKKMFDILLARGGDLKMNRAAVETKEVDILTHPEHNRYDCGMNHIMAKLAKNNSVAIEINFREIMTTNKKTRSRILSAISSNIALAKKYKMQIILCSGAISHWEMKDPKCMISMANKLGLPLNVAKDGVSKVPNEIIELMKKRQNKKWVMPGVMKK